MSSACEWCGGAVILEECTSDICDCLEWVCRECGNPAAGAVCWCPLGEWCDINHDLAVSQG